VTTYAAFLRAVNLAVHQKLPMADLREFFSALNLRDPRTVVATGNVVFESSAKAAALEQRLERESPARLSLRTEYFVRDAGELRAVVEGNPFPRQAVDDPSHLVVVLLRDEPAAAGVKSLRAAIKGREQVIVAGRHAFMIYPDGIGRSPVTAALVERHLGTRGTARNGNTVRKVEALAGGS
jgi:uncharacterized protein (DUF1697 family)